MNAEEFERIFARQFEFSQEVLVEKARQYASDSDRLHNFAVAAAFQGITPEQALLGMLTKHLVNISDMVKNHEAYYPSDIWDEKVGDAINYLILLRAQVFETDSEDSPEGSLSFKRDTTIPRHLEPVTLHQTTPQADAADD